MIRARLAELERRLGSRMIVAKLPANGDLDALLRSEGIEQRPSDLVVRITRPDGVGADFARMVKP